MLHIAESGAEITELEALVLLVLNEKEYLGRMAYCPLKCSHVACVPYVERSGHVSMKWPKVANRPQAAVRLCSPILMHMLSITTFHQ